MTVNNGTTPRKRGRLRIYLGFALGVGKTYNMLREGLYIKDQEQKDVVIGWLEDSWRADTVQFAKELETAPPIEIRYKGNMFKEMDVEGIVKRKPDLVLVDELAHTNIPGSLHEKRYQDIEYLRDRGINVMTTLNIQHVEGVKEAAVQITGAAVTETVPDWVLDKADEVELIDVSPQVIQQRLKEGKIFPSDTINRSTQSLFSANKLLALRELALLYVADEVDVSLEDYRQKSGLVDQVHVHERILVCVNSPATARRLIGTGGNMAKRLMVELFVLYVEVDCWLHDREEEFELTTEIEAGEPIDYIQQLAKKYGGTFLMAKVRSKSMIAHGITRVIREKKITRVIIGESGIPRWREVLRGSIITKILAEIHHVDILVAGNREALLHPGRGENKRARTDDYVNEKLAGKLKIYVGAAAGVGKTVAMLREAHELKSKGIDVVIGVIETHDRKETAEYVTGLESVPLKIITYRDVPMKELDVQGIIGRRPQVALIDELAHNNVPGSENDKRYQDVKEILEAGTDVISAINIQHIESLNDIVEDVTGVKVRETVPDAVVARADELVMVDVTTETLRGRLKSGKVYAADKIEQALNSFFRKENLQALRELALREVAQDIEEGKSYSKAAKDKSIEFPENILACVQARVNEDRLIRRGFRNTQRLKACFYVLHVMDGHRYSMPESQLLDILKGLAKRLGAVFAIERVTSKRQVITVMLNFIAQKNITRLVLGQSARTRWEEIKNGSIVNELLRKAKGIDILIVADPHRKT